MPCSFSYQPIPPFTDLYSIAAPPPPAVISAPSICEPLTKISQSSCALYLQVICVQVVDDITELSVTKYLLLLT
jgi:hypothetical protein